MTDRELMQQALEALENPDGLDEYNRSISDNAITALRAALAEPQTTHWEGCEAVHPECRKPEQEPVAWMSNKDFNPIRVRIMSEAYDLADRGDSEGYNAIKVMCGDVQRMLPPQRKPLTEGEMPSNTRYTVAVEGQAPTYWDCIHDAMTNAQRAVYSGVDNTTRAIDDLKAGRIAEWSYGFSAVRIYPPQNKTAPTPRKPVAWAEEIIEDLHALYDTEMIRENDSGDALIRLDDAIACVEDAKQHYTAPTPRKPLTDEEIKVPIQRAMQHFGFDPTQYSLGGMATIGFLGLVKEIETKLKAKNA